MARMTIPQLPKRTKMNYQKLISHILSKRIVMLVLPLVLLSADSAKAQMWTPWVVDNPRGTIREIKLQPNRWVSGIEIREQAGFGIVNLRARYTDQKSGRRGVTNWTCAGRNGERKIMNLPTGSFLQGAAAGEQDGFGIVDLRLLHVRRYQLRSTHALTKNKDVQRWFSEHVPVGRRYRPIRYIQVREQAGFGIVDIRFGY